MNVYGGIMGHIIGYGIGYDQASSSIIDAYVRDRFLNHVYSDGKYWAKGIDKENKMDKLKKDARLLLKCIDHWFNDILIDGDYSKSEGADCALCKEYRHSGHCGCEGCPLALDEFDGYNTRCCMEWINYRRGKNLPLAAKMIERLLAEYKTIINKLVSESEKKPEWEEVKITWRLEGGDMRGYGEFLNAPLVEFSNNEVRWDEVWAIYHDGTLGIDRDRYKINDSKVYRCSRKD